MINQGTGRWDRSRRDATEKRLLLIRKMLSTGCETEAVMERFNVSRGQAQDLMRAAKQQEAMSG